MEKKENYTWQEFAEDVDKIVQLIRESGRIFKNIYGPPRGGLVLAVCLSHQLGIPMILDESEITAKTLVVDDIADTGETLFIYAYHGNFIATLFYKRHCLYIPDIWLREKTKKYIRFPWEA